MKRFGRLALLLLALAPASAQALTLSLLDAPLRLDLSELATVAYHVDNGSIAPPGSVAYDPTGGGFTDWLNRFQVDLAWQDFTAMARLDTTLYVNPPVAAAGDLRIARLLRDRYQNRAELEKVAVGYGGKHLELTLGDAYVTYGRGLILAIRKYDELGVDTTVRGLSATGHLGGLNVNGTAGITNIINVDAATGRSADDPSDRLAAARAEYRFGTWVVPGVDIAHVQYAHNFSPTPQSHGDHVTSYSGTLELPNLADHGTLYLEYAKQRGRVGDGKQDSTAFYASGSAYLGPATLLLEYKNYRHDPPVATSLDAFRYPELALTDFYTAPPTLERVQQAVLNNSDVTGPHARLEVQAASGVAPFLSMAGFDDRVYRVRIYDPYAGVELRWQEGKSRASLSGGYRTSRYQDGPQAGQSFQDNLHAEYDVNQSLGGPYSIELDGLHQSHVDHIGSTEHPWREGQSYLSFKRAERYSAALGYEYYTEFPGTVRSSYWNGNVSWTVAPGVVLRLFLGGQRAGIKCVNGVCRNYPAFDGARGELLAHF